MGITNISTFHTTDMNDPTKDVAKEIVAKVFSLNTATAKSLIELVLLLFLIGGAGYLFDRGPAVLKIPAGLFIGMGTFVAFFLFIRVLFMKMSE